MTDLNANVSADQEWLPLTDADSRSLADGFYTIDTENVKVENGPHPATSLSISPYNGRRAQRGVGGSTAATHLSGASLTRYYPDAASAGDAGGVTVDNTVDAPEEVTTIVAPGAVVGAGSATLPTVVVSPDDPGAIGAGNLWLQSNAGEGGDDYYQLNVRNDTDDGWFGAGPITNTDRETYVTIASPDDSVELQIQNDGEGPSSLSGDFGAQSFQIANGATISTGADDPSLGAGVVATPGSVYLRTDGSLWTKTDADDTDWTNVFGAASLANYVSSQNINLAPAAAGTINLSAVDGQIKLIGLPSADPEVANQLYTDGVVSAGVPQFLKISGGPA